jgi:hypothetical protein
VDALSDKNSKKVTTDYVHNVVARRTKAERNTAIAPVETVHADINSKRVFLFHFRAVLFKGDD